MDALVLTLGHNSSAIYVQDGYIIAGYEEERFTLKKSDSSFPANAIRELQKNFAIDPEAAICVSHWNLSGALFEPNKYWNPVLLAEMGFTGRVHSLYPGFTHHDAHAEYCQSFTGATFADEYHILVMDGFGTAGECLSFYTVKGVRRKLIKRIYGFSRSIGMLYQYATAFAEMQMHNHEYKMLAYETHILEVIDKKELNKLEALITDVADKFYTKMVEIGKLDQQDPMLSLTALPEVQLKIADMLTGLLNWVFELRESVTLRDRRIAIAYIVQSITEHVVLKFLLKHATLSHIACVGGVFYNVKLNSRIADVCEKACFAPLAGDQGAGLGVYNNAFHDLKIPNHLFWGTRDLTERRDIEGLYYFETMFEAMSAIEHELTNIGAVNIVRGAMEFGPRALCHTTTLALPTKEVASMINEANDRTNEMPFAMVVSPWQAEQLFEDCQKVYKSLEYMICTRKFRKDMHLGFEGGAHYYPLQDVWTCRPQLAVDSHILNLVEKFGPLINTSFNYHGVPIVNNVDQVVYSHTKQGQSGSKINTIVITGDVHVC